MNYYVQIATLNYIILIVNYLKVGEVGLEPTKELSTPYRFMKPGHFTNSGHSPFMKSHATLEPTELTRDYTIILIQITRIATIFLNKRS